jgi:membrane-associated phospholipid phosphatase
MMRVEMMPNARRVTQRLGGFALLALLLPAPARAQIAPEPAPATVPWTAIWETVLLGGGEFILKGHEPTVARWSEPTRIDGGGTWAPDRRHTAHVLSNATLASALAIETAQIWRTREGRTSRLVNETRTLALTTALTEVVKIAAARKRPDNSDAVSFFSEHTAIVTAALVASIRHGGSKKALLVTLPLTAATAYLRVAAGKHWTSDVLAGAAAGALVGAFTP